MAEIVELTNKEWEQVNKIEGWLSRNEANQLYRLCTGVWVEVGSWKGKSTVVLARKHRGYAVDWFKGSSEHGTVNTYKTFQRNINKFPTVKVIRGDYHDVVHRIKESVQLLFLDAEHSYEATKEAFHLYAPLVEPGGIIILHDVNPWPDPNNNPWPGVTEFADELSEASDLYVLENADRSRAFVKL